MELKEEESTPVSQTQYGSYTAKLIDGPLEGKTVRTDFTNGGEPQPRITIPTDLRTKQYLYIRGNGFEFAGEDSQSNRPSAVEYRFVQAIFD